MKKYLLLASLSLNALALACQDERPWIGGLQVGLPVTHSLGANDNPEAIFAFKNNEPKIGLVNSKSKRLDIFELEAGKITLKASHDFSTSLQEDDEITYGAALNDRDFVLVSTSLLKNENGEIIACQGKLHYRSFEPNGQWRAVGVSSIGPMPDAIAVSPNGQWIITANERDSKAEAWGKCPVETEKPSISLIPNKGIAPDVDDFIHIPLSKNALGPREPEGVAIADDNDTVAVTLQDSHELALFKISALHKKTEAPSENDLKIIELPKNAAGQAPWPDGIAAFKVDDKQYFAIAGEWNDSLIIVDDQGQIIANHPIQSTDIPSQFPCNQEPNEPLYSPDSVAILKADNSLYAALSLRFAGAIALYELSSPSQPKFKTAYKVGKESEVACGKGKSKVRPEGITVTDSIIWTANEKEGSLSAVLAF